MAINTIEGAVRLAKTIMQDISLYNAEKIKEGLANDSIFDVLADEINEGRNLFRNRVDPRVIPDTGIYDRAINDFLLKEAMNRNRDKMQSKIF